jgi:hypothetical protein
MKWAGYVPHMGEKRDTCRVFVGKLEGMRPLGRTRCRWVDNIEVYLKEVELRVWAGFIWFNTGASGRL